MVKVARKVGVRMFADADSKVLRDWIKSDIGKEFLRTLQFDRQTNSLKAC